MIDSFIHNILLEVEDIYMAIKKHKGSKGNKSGKGKKNKMRKTINKSKEGAKWKGVQ